MVGLNNDPISGRIYQVAPSQAPVSTEAPQNDRVLDLSQVENLDAELTTQNAENTDYIKLSDESAVSVQDLSPEELGRLIDNIKTRALNGDLSLRSDLLPDSWLQLDGNQVTIQGHGSQTVAGPEGAPINHAEAVIQKSNGNPDDTNWAFTNGSSESLSFQQAADKPAPWNNHFYFAGDKAFIYQTQSDQREINIPGEESLELSLAEAQEMGLPQELLEEVKQTGQLRYVPQAQYQDMLQSDFNFNGAFDEFQSPEQFSEALRHTYPERVEALGEANFNALASRVYSYASAGQDSDGGIDVQEMQGMLYALDPEIRLSSNSNTPMRAQSLFAIDEQAYQQLSTAEQNNYAPSNQGGYVPLSINAEQYDTLNSDQQAQYMALGDRFVPLGDNKHGRATILTTRHIMENISHTEIPVEPMQFEFETGISSLFGANDRFIRDSSGSMTTKWNAVVNGVDAMLQRQGTLAPGESLTQKLDMNIKQGGGLTTLGSEMRVPRDVAPEGSFPVNRKNINEAVGDAYASFQSPDKSSAENQAAFAEMIGLSQEQLFTPEGEIQPNSVLRRGFQDLLRSQGRLPAGERLSDNLDLLIREDGGLQLSADESYTPERMTVGKMELQNYIEDFSNVLESAYQTTRDPQKSPEENQAHFAELLGLPPDDIFSGNGQLNGDKVMRLLGDTRGESQDSEMGSTGEAAFKGIITTLLFDPDYSEGSRMNVLIDEPLQDMEYLRLAQSMAEARGVDVRFISMPTRIENERDLEVDAEGYMVFVDLQSMQLEGSSDQPQALSFTEQHLDAQGNIQESPQRMDIEYYEGKVHDRQQDFSQNPDGFKGAYIPLNGRDAEGKLINRIGAGTE